MLKSLFQKNNALRERRTKKTEKHKNSIDFAYFYALHPLTLLLCFWCFKKIPGVNDKSFSSTMRDICSSLKNILNEFRRWRLKRSLFLRLNQPNGCLTEGELYWETHGAFYDAHCCLGMIKIRKRFCFPLMMMRLGNWMEN